MSQKEIAFKIEELVNKAETVDSLQNILLTAFCNPEGYSAGAFEWTFMLLGSLTGDLLGELKELTKNEFYDLRKDDKNDGKQCVQ